MLRQRLVRTDAPCRLMDQTGWYANAVTASPRIHDNGTLRWLRILVSGFPKTGKTPQLGDVLVKRE